MAREIRFQLSDPNSARFPYDLTVQQVLDIISSGGGGGNDPAVVLTTGSYPDPPWIPSLAADKVLPAFAAQEFHQLRVGEDGSLFWSRDFEESNQDLSSFTDVSATAFTVSAADTHQAAILQSMESNTGVTEMPIGKIPTGQVTLRGKHSRRTWRGSGNGRTTLSNTKIASDGEVRVIVADPLKHNYYAGIAAKINSTTFSVGFDPNQTQPAAGSVIYFFREYRADPPILLTEMNEIASYNSGTTLLTTTSPVSSNVNDFSTDGSSVTVTKNGAAVSSYTPGDGYFGAVLHLTNVAYASRFGDSQYAYLARGKRFDEISGRFVFIRNVNLSTGAIQIYGEINPEDFAAGLTCLIPGGDSPDDWFIEDMTIENFDLDGGLNTGSVYSALFHMAVNCTFNNLACVQRSYPPFISDLIYWQNSQFCQVNRCRAKMAGSCSSDMGLYRCHVQGFENHLDNRRWNFTECLVEHSLNLTNGCRGFTFERCVFNLATGGVTAVGPTGETPGGLNGLADLKFINCIVFDAGNEWILDGPGTVMRDVTNLSQTVGMTVEMRSGCTGSVIDNCQNIAFILKAGSGGVIRGVPEANITDQTTPGSWSREVTKDSLNTITGPITISGDHTVTGNAVVKGVFSALRDCTAGLVSGEGRQHVRSSTAFIPTQTLETVDPVNNNYTRRQNSQNSILTTNATPTTALTIPVPGSTTMTVHLEIQAAHVGGSSGASTDFAQFSRKVVVQRDGAAAAAIVGAMSSKGTDYNVATFGTPAAAVSGNNLLVNVTGKTNNTLRWNVDSSRIYNHANVPTPSDIDSLLFFWEFRVGKMWQDDLATLAVTANDDPIANVQNEGGTAGDLIDGSGQGAVWQSDGCQFGTNKRLFITSTQTLSSYVLYAVVRTSNNTQNLALISGNGASNVANVFYSGALGRWFISDSLGSVVTVDFSPPNNTDILIKVEVNSLGNVYFTATGHARTNLGGPFGYRTTFTAVGANGDQPSWSGSGFRILAIEGLDGTGGAGAQAISETFYASEYGLTLG